MPQISIIVPVFNAEASLTRCLLSLVHQTISDIEIICIDDGSNDASPVILQNFASNDDRISVVIQVNAGQAAARNRGLERIRSSYVMFCDSDDCYDLCCCERMLKTIQTELVDVVMCQTQVVVDSGVQRAVKKSYFNPSFRGRYTLTAEIASSCNTLVWNKIWKAEILQRGPIRFPEGHEHEDDAFWFMYALEAQTIYFLPERCCHHWIRSGSVMDKIAMGTPKNKRDRLAVARYVVEYARKRGYAHSHARWIVNYYRAECKGLQMDLFCAEECRQMIAELNAEQSGDDHVFFFPQKQSLTCVLKRDMTSWASLRWSIAVLASWFSFGLMRRAQRRERRYFRDVVHARKECKSL